MKILVLSLLLLPAIVAHAQKRKNDKVAFFVYDEKWDPCKIEKAKYLGCFEQLNDTAYQWKYYNFSGPLISIETYKDKEATIPHGYIAYYGIDGKMDSTGYTFNGRKNGHWYYFTDSLAVWQYEEYNNGKLIKRQDSVAMRKEREEQKEKADTVKRVEIEASYNGGDKAWAKYIQKNFEFPERARSLKKEGKVLIQFIVGKDGSVDDVSLKQSIEYSIDEEAIRLMRESPKWNPASQDGKFVKAYRLQPLTFQLP